MILTVRAKTIYARGIQPRIDQASALRVQEQYSYTAGFKIESGALEQLAPVQLDRCALLAVGETSQA